MSEDNGTVLNMNTKGYPCRAMKEKKKTKRQVKNNTSFADPSVSYTSRITCPARQMFYKEMEGGFRSDKKQHKKSIRRAPSHNHPEHHDRLLLEEVEDPSAVESSQDIPDEKGTLNSPEVQTSLPMVQETPVLKDLRSMEKPREMLGTPTHPSMLGAPTNWNLVGTPNDRGMLGTPNARDTRKTLPNMRPYYRNMRTPNLQDMRTPNLRVMRSMYNAQNFHSTLNTPNDMRGSQNIQRSPHGLVNSQRVQRPRNMQLSPNPRNFCTLNSRNMQRMPSRDDKCMIHQVCHSPSRRLRSPNSSTPLGYEAKSKKGIVLRGNRTSIQREMLTKSFLNQAQFYPSKNQVSSNLYKNSISRRSSQYKYPHNVQCMNVEHSSKAVCKVLKKHNTLPNNENLSGHLKYGVFSNSKRRAGNRAPGRRLGGCQTAPPDHPQRPTNVYFTPKNMIKRDSTKMQFARQYPGVKPLACSKVMHVDIKPTQKCHSRSAHCKNNTTEGISGNQLEMQKNAFFPTFRSVMLPSTNSADFWDTPDSHRTQSNRGRRNTPIYDRNIMAPCRNVKPVSLANRMACRTSPCHTMPWNTPETYSYKDLRPCYSAHRPESYSHRDSRSSYSANHRIFDVMCRNIRALSRSQSPENPRKNLRGGNTGSYVSGVVSPRKMSPKSSSYRTVSPDFRLSPTNTDVRVSMLPHQSLPTMNENPWLED